MAQCVRCGRTISGFTFGKKICGWCKQHEAAQRGEVSEYQPVMATPWKRSEAMPMLVTQAILGVCVAVFVGMALSGASVMQPTSRELLTWGGNYGPYTLTGQWWRLITSCFVHIGIFHIAMNMWCLWMLGGLAERLYGRFTFACVYLLCGISGSLASVWWHSTPTVSAGASGAIFGIAGAVIASLKLGEVSSRGMAQSTMQSLLAFVGYNVVFGMISGFADNACHVGGLLAGLALGALIAKAAPEAKLLPRLGVMLVVGAVLAGCGYQLWKLRAYSYYMMRAGDAIREGRVDAAVPLLEQVLKARPGAAAEIHYDLGHAYWVKKDYAAAERELRKALESAPKDEDILYELGGAQLEERKLAEARESFGKLLAMNPRSGEAHLGLGVASFLEGNCGAAMREYALAEQLEPKLGYVYSRQGRCLMQGKQYDAAIAAFHKEIEMSGNDAETQGFLAEALRAKGMTAEAEAAEKEALRLKNAD